MRPSYEKINYSLRPSKQIERKMMCETFRRLSVFGALDSYRYIGFGSIYFRDFILFHKDLGISNMISIEGDLKREERFEFNIPFECVKLKMGRAKEIFPTLPWDIRTIAWLDFDYPLDSEVLADISFFCANAISGSVLVVTVEATPGSYETPLENFAQLVGEDKLPPGTEDNDLLKWGTAITSRKVINNQILEDLYIRNSTRDPSSKLLYKQLFNFHYDDGTKMLTIGGVIYDKGQESKLAVFSMDELPFLRFEDEYCRIKVPMLTYKELHHLNAQLPTGDHTSLQAHEIPERDLISYCEFYRYFPIFVEVET